MTRLVELARRPDPHVRDAGVVVALLVLVVVAAVSSVVAPLALLGVGAVAVFVPLVARRPDLATLAVLVVLYSNAPVVAVRHHGLPYLVGAAFPLLLLVPLLHHVVVRRRQLRLGIAGPLLVLLALVHVVSAFASADWATSAEQVVAYLTNGLALYLLVVNVLRSEGMVRRAALALIATAALLGAMSLVHTLISSWPETRVFGFSELVRGDLLAEVDWESYFSTSHPDAEIRAVGPIGEANFYAFVLVLVLPYAAAFAAVPRDRLERVVSLLSLPWIAAGIVVTYSRGAAVVVAVVTGMLAVVGLLPRRTLLWLAGVAAVVGAVAPDYAARLLRLAAAPQLWVGGGTADVGDAALSGRYSEVVSAAYVWADHPVLGVGPGMFPANYQRYASELGFAVHDGPREAHNLFLHLASELGTVGLVVFLALLVTLARHLLAARRLAGDASSRAFSVAGLAVVGVIAVNGMFLHLAFERYLWVHVALLAAWCAEVRRTTRDATLDEGRAGAPGLVRS